MRKNQPQKINRIHYIVQENPEGVIQLLRSEGIPIPNHLEGLIRTTKEWISKEGKSAILKLLQAHPEKDLLLHLNQAAPFDNYADCGCKSSFTGGDCGHFDDAQCKCKSSFDGKESLCKRCQADAKKLSPSELLIGLAELRDEQLLSHYEEIKQASLEQPSNQRLKEEVAMAWEYIVGRLQTLPEPFQTLRKAPIQPISATTIAAPTKAIREETTPTKPKVRKRNSQQAPFTITSKELAISGFIIGVAALIAQFKS